MRKSLIVIPLLVAAGVAGCGTSLGTPPPLSRTLQRPSTSMVRTTSRVTTTPAPDSPGTPSPKQPPATPSPAAAPVPDTSRCRTLPATAAIKHAVTDAYLRYVKAQHLAPLRGGFFYGACSPVRYAAARFLPTPAATPHEQLFGQDSGAFIRVLISSDGDTWHYLTAGDGQHWSHPCTDIHQVPAPLATAWDGCHSPY